MYTHYVLEAQQYNIVDFAFLIKEQQDLLSTFHLSSQEAEAGRSLLSLKLAWST